MGSIFSSRLCYEEKFEEFCIDLVKKIEKNTIKLLIIVLRILAKLLSRKTRFKVEIDAYVKIKLLSKSKSG